MRNTITLSPTPTAGQLLAAMRPHIEEILGHYHEELPQCISQYHRCIHAVDVIEAKLNLLRGNKGPMNRRMQLIHQKDAIRKFMSVRETVRMISEIEDNGHLQF